MTVDRRFSRRQFLNASRGQALPAWNGDDMADDGRLAPVDELVNVPEFEAMARLRLAPDRFAAIGGGDRRSFDRMTFRQRLMVDALALDLTTELFGHAMFAPIVVGPVARQGALHAEGEVATARGASRAKAVMVACRDSSRSIDAIAAEATEPLWYQVYADDARSAQDDVARAVEAGCRVVCVTVGVSAARAPVAIDWTAVERLAQTTPVPVVAKGIMSADTARAAVGHGVRGVCVSNHGGLVGGGGATPVDVLPAVADVVGAEVPVLVDGGFRRGTDVLKGLALGATAVLLARPVMWGLAAYGAIGVQTVLELIQTELARNMAASGRPRIDRIDSSLVRFDSH